MSSKSNFNKDDIIKALLDTGIFCEEPIDGETHFYDENGKEIFFPNDFNLFQNVVDKE